MASRFTYRCTLLTPLNYAWLAGRMARTKYPVSLTTIARRTGLKPSHISKILNGRGVRVENVVKVAMAMGMSVDEFVKRYYPNLHQSQVA